LFTGDVFNGNRALIGDRIVEQQRKNVMTLKDIEQNEEIREYITKGNEYLGVMHYTEHGFAHLKRSAVQARQILYDLGYDRRTCELAAIAGYMHDIGNVINRVDHAHSGALMAFDILTRLGMPPREISQIIAAIGNHDEGTATAVNPIAAALILADKSDVRRTRVRNKETVANDIHDRVNYAVEKSTIQIDKEQKVARLLLTIDTEICPVIEYFEIFLTRMVLCRKAADFLELKFQIVINDARIL